MLAVVVTIIADSAKARLNASCICINPFLLSLAAVSSEKFE
jgi:hypothetical protein